MKVTPTELRDVLVLEPKVFQDERGFFLESYNRRTFKEATGRDANFVQDNQSFSVRNVLRGLHYQIRQPQGKLVAVMAGEIFDVAVDIRRGSATFGRWVGVRLSGENFLQLYVPPGFAHGFCVLSASVHVEYKCTDFYDPADEIGLAWDDPDVGIDWPLANPLVSEKDRRLPRLRELQALL